MGRQAAKGKAAGNHICMERLRIAESVLHLHEAHLKTTERWNEMLLFTGGPSGANLTIARRYFEVKQK